MTTETTFDALIIGTGQAGPSLAVRLAQAGLRTAIVERKRFGGTCVNYGCIPTKALVACARAAHVARRAADFGVMLDGEVRMDMRAVRQRTQKIIQESSGGVEKWLRSTEGLTVLEGHARFSDPHSIEIEAPNGRRRVRADRIFVNVGARPRVPEVPGIDDIEYFTSSSMLEVSFLPEHLVVVGGSYVGLEFAQMFRRFGSRVTVIDRNSRLLVREDPDVSQAIQEILTGEGIDLRLSADCIQVSKSANGVQVGVDCGEGAPTVVGSHVLFATGRLPNTHDLNADAAGLRLDERGLIPVDENLRTNLDHVWALGEVNGRGAFTHTTYNDYEIAAANLLDDDPRSVGDRILCYGLFVDPPLARIGMTEGQGRESGRDVLMGRMKMQRVGRAKERGETQGFMKVLVDAGTKRILGAALLGIEADEVVHCLLDVMYADAPYTTIQRAVHIHPTVSELIPTLLGDLRPLSA
ncbi:MAG: FAD-containing oxidoreductase [Thermoanaerobaculia bacterium]|nr:FAD-containing oxidoreductase [Thermoanaerobaculia bacterium]